MLLKALGVLTQSWAVFFKATFYHNFSKFYIEKRGRAIDARAALEQTLGLQLTRIKIDNPNKADGTSTTDGTAFYDDEVSILPQVHWHSRYSFDAIHTRAAVLPPNQLLSARFTTSINGPGPMQDKWAYFWLAVRLEVGVGLTEPLEETLEHCWYHTQARGRTHLLLPGLIFEQFGPFMRCVVANPALL